MAYASGEQGWRRHPQGEVEVVDDRLDDEGVHEVADLENVALGGHEPLSRMVSRRAYRRRRGVAPLVDQPGRAPVGGRGLGRVARMGVGPRLPGDHADQ